MLVRLFALLPLALVRLSDAVGIRAWALVDGTAPILLAAAAMGLVTYATDRFIPWFGSGVVPFVVLILEGVALYIGALLVIDPKLLRLLTVRNAPRTPDRS